MIMIALMALVATAGLDNLPRELRAPCRLRRLREQVAADHRRFETNLAVIEKAKAAEPALFQSQAPGWDQRLKGAEGRLRDAEAQAASLATLAGENRREDSQKVAQGLAQLRSARAGAPRRKRAHSPGCRALAGLQSGICRNAWPKCAPTTRRCTRGIRQPRSPRRKRPWSTGRPRAPTAAAHRAAFRIEEGRRSGLGVPLRRPRERRSASREHRLCGSLCRRRAAQNNAKQLSDGAAMGECAGTAALCRPGRSRRWSSTARRVRKCASSKPAMPTPP